MELTDLYREVILDHNRHPRNFGRLDPADGHADGHNPLCGDRLAITVRNAGDRLQDLRFEGNGCAISMASASLMTEAVKGLSHAEVDALFARMHAMLTGSAAPAADLGKLAALAGVREFPVRVKCASLCWHTLQAALADAASGHAAPAAPVSTE
ncbi:MAG: SUF system NifU family Fe-S cluster assembly protein [Steroidobacteraceae bacterium]